MRTTTTFRTVAAGVYVLVLGSCYLTTQGYHLLQHQVAAQPLDRVRGAIPAGTVGAREEAFFTEVAAIRRFGLEELRLDAGKAFTTYVRTEKGYLADVVSAARSDSFERKEWWFPVFGRFPYKGFYRPEGARRLAADLRDQGWDVYSRRVDAFSTLGFFREPLYSYMIAYEDARLADLILHEMAHATLWVRDEAQFNEEFATFVGRTGARDYLVRRYGIDDPRVVDLDRRRRDGDRFRRDILALRDRLQQLYVTGREDDRVGRTEILVRKHRIIREFQAEFAATYPDSYQTDNYRGAVTMNINNAYLDLFATYAGNLHVLEEYHRVLDGPLEETIAAIVHAVTNRPAGVAPIEVVRREIVKNREKTDMFTTDDTNS